MSLRSEFQSLGTQLERVSEVFSDLRRFLDDHPSTGDKVMLLDAFADAVEEIRGWLQEGRAAIEPLMLKQDGEQGFDLDLARQALVSSQDRFNRVARCFSLELVSYDRVAQLLRLGRERGGEWQAWAKGVKMELEGCQPHLYLANQALFGCWVEIAERIGMTSVSVQATNIGQQITVPTTQELRAEGMT